jgi:hypothetical protein
MTKNILFIFLFSSILLSCSGQTKKDLRISDLINVDSTKSIKGFPGTNIFIDIPASYTLVENTLRYQKDNDTYVQLVQIPSANFESKVSEFKVSFDNEIKKNNLPKEYYTKSFKLGKYQALLYYVKDTKPNSENILLFFGDNSFVSMAIGVFPTDKTNSRDEILNSLLSLNVNTNFKTDPTKLAKFTIDITNTDFKFFGNASQFFYYTINGKGDPIQNQFENQIMIMQLPAFKTKESLKEYAISMIANYKNAGMTIPNYSIEEITINGNAAYEIKFNGSFKGRQNSAYQIVTSNNNSAILFLGGLYDNIDKLLSQVIQVSKTIRLK